VARSAMDQLLSCRDADIFGFEWIPIDASLAKTGT
jgi:hypothetical protein